MMLKYQTFLRSAVIPLSMLLAFALTACQMEETSRLAEEMIQGRHVTFLSSYENPDSETKTSLHSDGHVYWVPGDAISVFYGGGTDGGSRFQATVGQEERVSAFSGTIDVLTGVSEATLDEVSFWGIYPYDPEASCDGQSVTTSIKALQTGAPDTFSSGSAPSMAKSPGLLLAFRNIYSGIWFTVTRPGFQRVTIRSNGGELLAGKARIGLDADGLPDVKEMLSGTDAVTLTAPGGGEFEPGKKYYLILFPCVMETGFTMDVESTTEVGAFKVSRSASFRRNLINNVANLDTKATFDYIKVNAANFPDPIFRQYVLNNIDKDGDELLSVAEREAVTIIDVPMTEAIGDYGIETLKGIAFFGNLEELNCRGNRIAALDLSANPAVRILDCSANELTSIDLSSLTALEELSVSGNSLSKLDLSKNTGLTYLACGQNNLQKLSLTGLSLLKGLVCSDNKLTSLELSACPLLTSLSCAGNLITLLDLSVCPQLEAVVCDGNPLPDLNVSMLPSLSKLHCVSSQMQFLYLVIGQNIRDLRKHENTRIIYLTDGDGINVVRDGYGKKNNNEWE